jgi:glycosyltransferase involved in cell wall biosynthesis
VDCIYSTGGAWSAHLAGLWLKKVTGVKLIAEIHDPLVIRASPSDEGFGVPRNRDARFRKYLETSLCKFADDVWWFTDGALHYAKIRNPNLNTLGNAHGFMVLPGAEPPGGLRVSGDHLYADTLNLSHSGSLAKDRSISTILNALHSLLKKYPEARQHIRIHVYGAPLDALTRDALEQYQYHDVLINHGRLEKDPVSGISGRERVVQELQKSDVLILLHGNDEWCAEYIPSKFYEYLWTGRPIWGIVHRNPQLDQMLSERGSYLSHQSDKVGIDMALERIWLDWQKRQLPTPRNNPIDVRQAVATILNTIK